MATKRGGLGTNLDSLIPTSLTVAGTEVAQQNEVPVSQISPNPRQPRTIFNEEAMAELVASIKSIGILQPPVVRKVAENKYELPAFLSSFAKLQITSYFAKRSLKTFIAVNLIHLKKALLTHNS
jgi:hypothetical protein